MANVVSVRARASSSANGWKTLRWLPFPHRVPPALATPKSAKVFSGPGGRRRQLFERHLAGRKSRRTAGPANNALQTKVAGSHHSVDFGELSRDEFTAETDVPQQPFA